MTTTMFATIEYLRFEFNLYGLQRLRNSGGQCATPYRFGGSYVVCPAGKEGLGSKVAWKNVVPILTVVVGTLLAAMAMGCLPFG